MGMLSLAGIVSGAGAGAGKSLRQAQTYLNWEMLQEERGKLELARDERINERHIANLTEQRAYALSEEDRLEKKRNDPETIKKEFTRRSLIAEGEEAEWDKRQPFEQKKRLAEEAAWRLGAGFREEQYQEGVNNAYRALGDKQDLEWEALTGKGAVRLKEAIHTQSLADQQQAVDDIEHNLKYLQSKPELFKIKQAVAKMSLSEMDKFAYNKAQFEDKNRGAVYAATIADKDISHLQLAENSIEKSIISTQKLLQGTYDPGQQKALTSRLEYLNKQSELLSGRIIKLTTGSTLKPFEMPDKSTNVDHVATPAHQGLFRGGYKYNQDEP